MVESQVSYFGSTVIVGVAEHKSVDNWFDFQWSHQFVQLLSAATTYTISQCPRFFTSDPAYSYRRNTNSAYIEASMVAEGGTGSQRCIRNCI